MSHAWGYAADNGEALITHIRHNVGVTLHRGMLNISEKCGLMVGRAVHARVTAEIFYFCTYFGGIFTRVLSTSHIPNCVIDSMNETHITKLAF